MRYRVGSRGGERRQPAGRTRRRTRHRRCRSAHREKRSRGAWCRIGFFDRLDFMNRTVQSPGDALAGTPPAREDPVELATTPLLPEGFRVPASRWTPPSRVLRQRLETQPSLFAPGIFDPHGAELVMYHGLDAVY